MNEIVKVEAEKNYCLKIEFNDGVKGVVDLSGLVGKGVFKAWKNLKYFEQVRIDEKSKTVSWPNGVDLAPEVLYEEVKQK